MTVKLFGKTTHQIHFLLNSVTKAEKPTSHSRYLTNMSALTQGVMVDEQHVKMIFLVTKKASDLYFGCSGAYCNQCTTSKSDGQVKYILPRSFSLKRSVETMHLIFNEFEENGEIVKKKKGNYAERQRQCYQPIPQPDQELIPTKCYMDC